MYQDQITDAGARIIAPNEYNRCIVRWSFVGRASRRRVIACRVDELWTRRLVPGMQQYVIVEDAY